MFWTWPQIFKDSSKYKGISLLWVLLYWKTITFLTQMRKKRLHWFSVQNRVPHTSFFYNNIWPWAGRGGKKTHSGAKSTLINCEYFSRPSLNTCISSRDRETVINKRVSLEKKLVRNNSLLNFWQWRCPVWQVLAASICCEAHSLPPGHCSDSPFRSREQQWNSSTEGEGARRASEKHE